MNEDKEITKKRDNPKRPLLDPKKGRNINSYTDDYDEHSPTTAEGSSSTGEVASDDAEENSDLQNVSFLAILRYIGSNLIDTKQNIAFFSGSMLILLLLGLSNVAGPFLISQALDAAQENEGDYDASFDSHAPDNDTSTFTLLTIGSALIFLAKMLHASKEYIAEDQANHVKRGLIKQITQNVLQAGPKHVSGITSTEKLGSIIQPTMEGIDKIFKNAFSLLPLTLEITAASAALFTFLDDPLFGVVFLSSTAASTLIGTLLRKCFLQKIEEGKEEKREDWLNFNKETLEKLQTLDTYDYGNKRINELTKKMIEHKWQARTDNRYQTVISLLQVSLVLIANFGYLNFAEWRREYKDSNIKIEDIAFVITYLLISIDNLTYGANYLKDMFDGYHKIARSLKGVNAIKQALEDPRRVPTELGTLSSGLSSRITIQLERSDEEDIILTPGTATAFVGASGCGKSTIIRKLAGLLQDKNAKGITINSSFQKGDIIYVSQHPEIFDGSLDYNVCLGLPEDMRENQENLLNKVCAQVGLTDKRREKSINDFSGGQQQRVGIARALIKYEAYNYKKEDREKRPFVFIFDESTSALDNEMEEKVMDIIYALRDEGNIVVLIAHRLDSITSCDNVVFLEMEKNKKSPRIIDQDSHKELYVKCERYKKFFETGRWSPDSTSNKGKKKDKEKVDDNSSDSEQEADAKKNKLRLKSNQQMPIQNSKIKEGTSRIYTEGNHFTHFQNSQSSALASNTKIRVVTNQKTVNKLEDPSDSVENMQEVLETKFQGIRTITPIKEDTAFQIIFDSQDTYQQAIERLYTALGSTDNGWSIFPEDETITVQYSAVSRIAAAITPNRGLQM